MTNSKRKQQLAAVHIAKKELALTDPSYRDVIRRVTEGRVSSSADCTPAELDGLLAEFRRLGWKGKGGKRGRAGSRPQSGDPRAAKARALWIALYHLGEIENASEEALASFVQRQTSVAAMQWLGPEDYNKVIEALKAMCERAGFTVPQTKSDGGREAKVGLLKALWAKLHAAGKVQIADQSALTRYLSRRLLTYYGGFIHMSNEQLDEGIEILGKWLRR